MAEHQARVVWRLGDAEFMQGKYSREHAWEFDGGAVVAASASPSNVPLPYSNAGCVDPEEAFVAAVASCHMLWFLSLARKTGFLVESYLDDAVGVMTRNEQGASWISEITLRPTVKYSADRIPTELEEREIHHHAHEQCFIANSIRSKVTVAGRQS